MISCLQFFSKRKKASRKSYRILYYSFKERINVLKKPYTSTEIKNIIESNLQGENPKEMQKLVIEDCRQFLLNKVNEEFENLNKKYEKLISEIYKEK